MAKQYVKNTKGRDSWDSGKSPGKIASDTKKYDLGPQIVFGYPKLTPARLPAARSARLPWPAHRLGGRAAGVASEEHVQIANKRDDV